MSVIAVDLAAKLSAWVKMGTNYQVTRQADSFNTSEPGFLFALTSDWRAYDNDVPEILVVEDLPHGLSYTTLVKTVCRLQGRLIEQMHASYNGKAGDILFVAPNTWRAHYKGMERGTGPDAVFGVAARFGYQPPPGIEERTKGKGGPSKARKIASDYCAAYLIGRWAIDTKNEYGTYDVPGTSRYDTKQILKKDFDAENC